MKIEVQGAVGKRWDEYPTGTTVRFPDSVNVFLVASGDDGEKCLVDLVTADIVLADDVAGVEEAVEVGCLLVVGSTLK